MKALFIALKCNRHFFSFFCFTLLSTTIKAQNNPIILGRPTDQSVTASVLFDQNTDFYFSYGLQPGFPSDSTGVISATAAVPTEYDLTNLIPNSRYYYRMYTRRANATSFTASAEYSFHTQRAQGNDFTFTIEADEHLYDKKGSANTYQICLNNQAADNPDFIISLGDIFGDDHFPDSMTSSEMDSLHLAYRPFLGSVCHSAPFYVCLGNHEGENDYYLAQNPPNNIAVWGTQWRKHYYPNPYPNGFYSGNTTQEPFGIGYPENYYAWNWGDALFIVLDVYRDQCDTSPKPKGWNWSLGQPQYDWLKNTLDTSTATFKFVFAHHILGQGRGGVVNATRFEWGGYEQNGNNYTFPTNRPGWAAPIHDLFVNAGVNIFFQGHDHVFAREELDGIVYQAAPMAADSTYEIGMLANADAYLSDTLEGTGHLRVHVTDNCVTVDFVRTYLPADTIGGIHQNGEVAFSYTVGSCATSSVNEIEAADEVQLFPVPAKDRLNIKLNRTYEIPNWKLYDTSGRCIKSGAGHSLSTDTIQNGIYFCTITTFNNSYTRKVIIKHD